MMCNNPGRGEPLGPTGGELWLVALVGFASDIRPKKCLRQLCLSATRAPVPILSDRRRQQPGHMPGEDLVVQAQ